MIDPLKPKTSVTTLQNPAQRIPTLELWSRFTAPEDITLEQVVFTGSGTQCLSSDPDLTPLEAGESSNIFQLFSANLNALANRAAFSELAFPMPKGTQLYWGGDAKMDQTLQLIFT